MTGIISYGFYVPKYRISTEEIAKTWGKNADEIKRSLNIQEKAVASVDEDIVTMAFSAASMALDNAPIDKKDIAAVFFGSETFPYAVKPASAMVAEWCAIGNDYLAYDTEFACKAATGAMLSAFAHAKANPKKLSLVLAGDKANARPHDVLEFTAGSGANAWIVGSKNVLLEVIDSHSYTSDSPDFWRRAGVDYPSHAGRFTGKPSYMRHITAASKTLMEKQNMKPTDFTYGVFHMPNGKFPLEVGLSLGFTKEQIMPSLVVSQLGNSYSASGLMGLVSILEKAKAGDTIFFASFGSGAGSDAMIFKVTDEIEKRRRILSEVMKDKTYIDYATYLKFMGVV